MMPVISDMMRVALAQYVVAFALTALSAVFMGRTGAASALMGGLGYAIPTTAYIGLLVLMRFVAKSVTIKATLLLFGEFVKILFVVLLLLLGVEIFGDSLNWPAFLISLIAVANSYFVLLFKKH